MFGERLKQLRDEKGMSQEELAAILNVTQQTVNNYENNKREPKQEMLCKIAEYFSVSIDWLVRGNKLTIPDDPKYAGYTATLEDEYARKGLSPEAQREILDAAIKVMEETKKRYKIE